MTGICAIDTEDWCPRVINRNEEKICFLIILTISNLIPLEFYKCTLPHLFRGPIYKISLVRNNDLSCFTSFMPLGGPKASTSHGSNTHSPVQIEFNPKKLVQA